MRVSLTNLEVRNKTQTIFTYKPKLKKLFVRSIDSRAIKTANLQLLYLLSDNWQH